jgi:L-ascorbate metabolism protein UlaG (beta-lactamase superfamily)
MILQLIRNATLRLTYAGETILIDPDLAAPLTRPSFTGRSANPIVDLPLPLPAIAAGLSLILVSHLHRDHFDAVESLPAGVPLLCQPGDEGRIAERGFTQVLPVGEVLSWNRIRLTRVGGQHGTGKVGQLMGAVSGFVFEAAGEPTLYWAGDTINGPEVAEAIGRFAPAVIVTHSCGAMWPDDAGARQLIVMDAAQTIAVCRAAPASSVVATHMESLDHATVSRAELRAAAEAAGVSPEQLLIPPDGGELTFAAR